jgi:hypothetical protein
MDVIDGHAHRAHNEWGRAHGYFPLVDIQIETWADAEFVIVGDGNTGPVLANPPRSRIAGGAEVARTLVPPALVAQSPGRRVRCHVAAATGRPSGGPDRLAVARADCGAGLREPETRAASRAVAGGHRPSCRSASRWREDCCLAGWSPATRSLSRSTAPARPDQCGHAAKILAVNLPQIARRAAGGSGRGRRPRPPRRRSRGWCRGCGAA